MRAGLIAQCPAPQTSQPEVIFPVTSLVQTPNLITSIGGLGFSGLMYDELGQLVSATDAGGSSAFALSDANGNRTSAAYAPGGSASYNVSSTTTACCR